MHILNLSEVLPCARHSLTSLVSPTRLFRTARETARCSGRLYMDCRRKWKTCDADISSMHSLLPVTFTRTFSVISCSFL